MAYSSNKPAVGNFMPLGYDYEFVDKVPEEYVCNICFFAMWKPVQTKCGHRFCKDCLKEANKRKKPQQCPEDRQELRKQDVFDDKATERQILSLKIKCPNNGCQWLGELGDLKDHTCTPTSRNLKCGGQKVKTKKIPNYLTEEGTLTQLVPCVYQRFGCNVKTPRKDMDQHIVSSIGHHFNITCERLLLLEDQILQLKKSQMEVGQQYQNLNANFLKEKDQRETIAKELTSLKTNVEQKLVRLDKNIQTLIGQKGEFSKEIKNLKKQIKQQVGEQTTTGPRTAVNTAKTNKDLAEKIERSRLRMETSIDELSRDFDKKMKKTIHQLQQELDQKARRIRDQIRQRSNFEHGDRTLMRVISRQQMIRYFEPAPMHQIREMQQNNLENAYRKKEIEDLFVCFVIVLYIIFIYLYNGKSH